MVPDKNNKSLTLILTLTLSLEGMNELKYHDGQQNIR